MYVSELTRNEMEELKQNYLCQHLEKIEGRTPSWMELSNVNECVSDEEICEHYSGIEFSKDDFFCNMEV